MSSSNNIFTIFSIQASVSTTSMMHIKNQSRFKAIKAV